jgi:hypothetical protein
MIYILTSIAMDISLNIAWWIAKQVTYNTVNTITYMIKST